MNDPRWESMRAASRRRQAEDRIRQLEESIARNEGFLDQAKTNGWPESIRQHLEDDIARLTAEREELLRQVRGQSILPESEGYF